MVENEQALRMKILDELENYVRGKFVNPAMSMQEQVEAERAQIQAICDMAYDGGFSDIRYVVGVEFHEDTGTAEFVLTEAIPFAELCLHLELDTEVYNDTETICETAHGEGLQPEQRE